MTESLSLVLSVIKTEFSDIDITSLKLELAYDFWMSEWNVWQFSQMHACQVWCCAEIYKHFIYATNVLLLNQV